MNSFEMNSVGLIPLTTRHANVDPSRRHLPVLFLAHEVEFRRADVSVPGVMEIHSLCRFEMPSRLQFNSGEELSPHNEIDSLCRPLRAWLMKHPEVTQRSR